MPEHLLLGYKIVTLPMLKDLLEEKFILLLGAGASVDYGYPTWDDLRPIMLDKLLGSKRDTKLDASMVDFWSGEITNQSESGKTIDQIISSGYRNLVDRRFIVDLIIEIIADYEHNDKENASCENKWISNLRSKFVHIIDEAVDNGNDERVMNYMNNFNVISLNYDRCFSNHFFPEIVEYFSAAHLKDRDFLNNQKKVLNDFFKISQPHGSLGALSLEARYNRHGNPIRLITSDDGIKYNEFNNNPQGGSYGNVNIRGQNIELVGEGDMTENYKKLNSDICKDAKYCLIIGLSKDGIKGAKIDWRQFEIIYYSGAEYPFSGDDNPFNSGILVESLGMHADKIVNNL